MKFGRIITGLLLFSVAACQSTPSTSPEEQARQLEYEREDTRLALADCGLVDLLNQRRIKSGDKPLFAPDCVYVRKKGTLAGFDGRGPQLPNFVINGIPIPIGTMVAVGQAAERTGNRNRALQAKVGGSVKSKDAELVVRKMMMRGYKQEEVMAVSGAGAFSSAVTATRRARLYLEANKRS